MLDESLLLKKSVAPSVGTFMDSQDQYDEDKIMKEVSVLSDKIYKKIIECVALYYSQWMIDDAEIIYDKILLDISRDVIQLMKLLALYVPMLCNNKKIPLKTKIKKLTVVTGVMAASLMWMHAYYKNKIAKPKSMEPSWKK